MIIKDIYKSSKLFLMLLLLGGFYGVQASTITINFKTVTGQKKQVSFDKSTINNLASLKKLALVKELNLHNETIDDIWIAHLGKSGNDIDVNSLKDQDTITIMKKLIIFDPSNNDNEDSIDPTKKKENDTTTTGGSVDDPNKNNNDGTFWGRNKWYIILGGGGFLTLVVTGITMVGYSKREEKVRHS